MYVVFVYVQQVQQLCCGGGIDNVGNEYQYCCDGWCVVDFFGDVYGDWDCY